MEYQIIKNILTWTVISILITSIESAGIRVREIDRKTSGRLGKDACSLSLNLDWDQFEQICPIRQLATLKKQITDAKRMIQNITALEATYEAKLMDERHSRESLLRRVDALHNQVGNYQRELTQLRRILANISHIQSIPLETQTAPPPVIIYPTPDYNLQRLSLQRNRDLERRVKMLESKVTAFESVPVAKSCGEIKRWGSFPIRPEGAPAPFEVVCMREWTVIARRLTGTENFFRNWQDYKHGFGNVSGDYWIGNDNIHYLTTQKKYRLRIDIKDWNGTESFSVYDTFYIDGEDDYYRIHVGSHLGPLPNALYVEDEKSPFNHNGMYFSTYDRDMDNSDSNCAEVYSGGYWYNDCYASNLNGPYCERDEGHSRCMIWWGEAGRMVLRSVVWRIKELPESE